MLSVPRSDIHYSRAIRFITALWVVLLVLTLFPFTADPAAPIKNLISAYAVLLMALVWLGAVLLGGQGIRIGTPGFLLLGAFFAVHVLASLFSPFPANSLNTLRPWMVLGLLAVFTAQAYREEKDTPMLLAVAVAAVALSSVYGFSQAAGFDPFPWSTKGIEEYHGLPSTYANPNFAGHALVIGIIMGLGLMALWGKPALAQRSPRNVGLSLALLLAVLLMGIHLYFTHMRGGRVALMAAALLLAVFWLFRRRFAPLRAAVLSGAVVAFLAVLAMGVLFAGARHVSKDPTIPVDSSLVLRLNGYSGACRMIFDHPFLGIGVGNYSLENIPYWTSYEKRWFATEGKKNYHVHCDVLESGVDAGIPGAGLYLVLLIWGILASLVWGGSGAPGRTLGYVLAAGFAAFGVDGLFGFNLRVPVSSGLFFLLFGLLNGLTQGEAPPAKRSAGRVAIAVGLTLLAVLFTVLETRSFLGERFYQRANGAQYWAADAAKKGDPRMESMRLQAGEALLEQARSFMPWDSRFPEAQGQIDLKLHRPDEAITHFQAALDRQPKHPGMLISLAQARINQALRVLAGGSIKDPLEYKPFTDQLEGAEAAAKKAIALCEGLPEAYEAAGRAAFLRAVALEDKRKDAAPEWAKAVDGLSLALRYGTPNRGAVQRMMAQIYVRTQQADKAEEYFKQAAESEPADPETWRFFRTFARDAQRPRACLDALSRNYGRVKERNPVPLDTLALLAGHLAEVYAAMGEAALAKETLYDAVPRAPRHIELWGVYARLSPPADRLAATQQLWKTLSTRPGVDLGGIPPLARALAEADVSKPDSLVQVSQMLVENVEARRKEAPLETVTNDLGWAVEILLSRVEDLKNAPETQGVLTMNLGLAYAALGRLDAADKLLGRAVPLLPPAQQAPVLVRRSEVLAGMKRAPDALAAAQAAAQLAPGNGDVRLNLARRLAMAGRLAEAKFEYVALLQQTPNDVPQYGQMQAELKALESKRAPQ